MKTFNIPIIYKSPLITAIKTKRRNDDKMKKDLSPSLLDFGAVQIYLARHFGFCYGVENAIDISFRTIADNPDKRIFLLSEMIHNPNVNADLMNRGVRFLQDNSGRQLIPFEELDANDIVITPAFGTTLEIESKLNSIGITIEKYNTTCPFVEKVWNRSGQLSKNNYTVIIHGNAKHEETRATFSHSAFAAPTVIVNNMNEAVELSKYITNEKKPEQFYIEFKGQHSEGFNVDRDFEKIGVINQTTMLAADTQAIADYLKDVMIKKYGITERQPSEHFADTRDTLCYATHDNQAAVAGLTEIPYDLAIVIGGYNSSNTSHLAELCALKGNTYFIKSEDNLLSKAQILHYDLHLKEELITTDYIPDKVPVKILITSGASCPDMVVEGVVTKLSRYFGNSISIQDMIQRFI